MNIKDQKEAFDAFAKKQAEIMLSKGDDYATEDRLSNFKLVAQIVQIPVETVIDVFIATKTVRLCNLRAKGAKPQNESVQDNLLDLANYTQLRDMVAIDTEKDRTCCGNWDELGNCKCKQL